MYLEVLGNDHGCTLAKVEGDACLFCTQVVDPVGEKEIVSVGYKDGTLFLSLYIYIERECVRERGGACHAMTRVHVFKSTYKQNTYKNSTYQKMRSSGMASRSRHTTQPSPG